MASIAILELAFIVACAAVSGIVLGIFVDVLINKYKNWRTK